MEIDPLIAADLMRAENSIRKALSNPEPDNRAKRKAFIEVARMITHARDGSALAAMQKSDNYLIRKAATTHTTADDVFHGHDIAPLAASFIASIAENSLLDQIAKYARVLPAIQSGVMMAASAIVPGLTQELKPKLVKNLDLGIGAIEPYKPAAILVVTEELLVYAQQIFELELATAVTAATNKAVLAHLIAGTVVEISDAGDPLKNLRAGLQVAGPSMGYVIAAPAGDVAWLATHEANKAGMGVRGGTFVAGVDVVAVDALEVMHVIPASRFAVKDWGLEVSSARHATVNMSDTPESESVTVNLWQQGLYGLLAERQFILSNAPSVVVGG